jgi:hypothetical protein
MIPGSETVLSIGCFDLYCTRPLGSQGGFLLRGWSRHNAYLRKDTDVAKYANKSIFSPVLE